MKRVVLFTVGILICLLGLGLLVFSQVMQPDDDESRRIQTGALILGLVLGALGAFAIVWANRAAGPSAVGAPRPAGAPAAPSPLRRILTATWILLLLGAAVAGVVAWQYFGSAEEYYRQARNSGEFGAMYYDFWRRDQAHGESAVLVTAVLLLAGVVALVTSRVLAWRAARHR